MSLEKSNENDMFPTCPKCKTAMKPINKRYSKTFERYYFSEFNCEICGSGCSVDEQGIIEYFDRDGKKLYGGK